MWTHYAEAVILVLCPLLDWDKAVLHLNSVTQFQWWRECSLTGRRCCWPAWIIHSNPRLTGRSHLGDYTSTEKEERGRGSGMISNDMRLRRESVTQLEVTVKSPEEKQFGVWLSKCQGRRHMRPNLNCYSLLSSKQLNTFGFWNIFGSVCSFFSKITMKRMRGLMLNRQKTGQLLLSSLCHDQTKHPKC